jgi:DNA-binding ferritin-like protein
MANNTPNTGPQQNPNKSILDAKEALKLLIDDQGDYNNLLKSSLKDLDSMQKSYTKIAARLDSLNKGSINVKQVQQELIRLKQKEYTSQQKIIDLQQGLSDETKNQLAINENLNKKLQDQLTNKERQKVLEQKKLNDKRLEGNIELKNLEYAKVQAKIAEEETKNGEKFLETEKKVSKQMGISGNLAKLFADKLGVGEEAYEAMSFESRKLVKQQGDQVSSAGKWKVAAKGIGAAGKALISNIFDPAVLLGGAGAAFNLLGKGLDGIGNAAASAGNFMAGLSEDSGNVVRGLTSGVSDLARKIPLVGGLIGGLVDGFSALLDLVLGVDNMIVKTGRQLNLSAEGARNLYRNLAAASQASGDIYTNGKKLLESQLELTQQTGITNTLNTEILRTNIKLKDFAGLEADTRARIAETAQITGKSAEGTVKSVLSQVKGLERATGVSLQYQQVLKEVSSLGGYLGLQFAKYPDKLAKAFVTTKALGLELKQLDGMASSFLDFESSISKEFEAQLLTGKDINLSKARELFLNNDLAGAAAEIAKHTGDAAGYSKMNRIQQDSLAEAMGMSRDQMADMLKQQELYSKFGVKNREDLLKQVDSLRKAGKEQEAINKAGGEGAYNDLVRASAQEKLALTIEKIKQSIVEFIERSGIIEKVTAFVDKLSNPDTIKGIIGTIRDTISTFIKFAGDMLADIIEVGGEIADFFTPFGKTDYSEKAKIAGAKVREGSLEMSERIKGTGNYGATTIQDAAAKDKLKSEPAAAKTPDNSMSMAKPPETKVYVLNQMNAITGKALTVPIEEGVYFAQGGQVGKSTT